MNLLPSLSFNESTQHVEHHCMKGIKSKLDVRLLKFLWNEYITQIWYNIEFRIMF